MVEPGVTGRRPTLADALIPLAGLIAAALAALIVTNGFTGFTIIPTEPAVDREGRQ